MTTVSFGNGAHPAAAPHAKKHAAPAEHHAAKFGNGGAPAMGAPAAAPAMAPAAHAPAFGKGHGKLNLLA